MLDANSTGLLVKSILVPEREPSIYIKSDIILPLKMDKLSNACTPTLDHMPIRYFSAYQVSRDV